MLRERGNIGHVLVEYGLVLAPKPKIGKLSILAYEPASIYKRSL